MFDWKILRMQKEGEVSCDIIKNLVEIKTNYHFRNVPSNTSYRGYFSTLQTFFRLQCHKFTIFAKNMDFVNILRPLYEVLFEDQDEDYGVEEYFFELNWFPHDPEYRGHYRAFIPRCNNYVERIIPLYNHNDFIQTFRYICNKIF